jgi:hypothetical protein
MNMRHAPALVLALLLIAPPSGATEQDGGEVRASRPAPAPKFSVDGVRVEVGSFLDQAEADGSALLRATPKLAWRASRAWELQASGTLEALSQWGDRRSYDRQNLIAGDAFLRYRDGDTRLTAGWQTIIWARVDEIPLIDRVSRVDLDRLWLDSLADRRLPLPALRWEQGFETFNLDIVALPSFRGARMPDRSSLWHPVDPVRGAIAGLDLPAPIAAFVSVARLEDSSRGTGGLALRLSRDGDGFAVGATVSHTRQSLPYFVADTARGALVETHPFTRFAGLDGEWVRGGATWRTETGLTWDAPVTATDGTPLRRRLIEWVGAVEFFPGDGDLRVNLQLLARSVRAKEPLLERKDFQAIGGELSLPLDKGRWKLGLRFNAGLNVHDNYVSPQVAYLGWEPHEVYLKTHVFDGRPSSLSGYHGKHDTVVFGLKTSF